MLLFVCKVKVNRVLFFTSRDGGCYGLSGLGFALCRCLFSTGGSMCSTAKEGGPFSLTTSPFPPYGGNLQRIHT